MLRTEFEGKARDLWRAAFGAQADERAAAVEILVQTTVGLAYGERLLDQSEDLPAAGSRRR